MASTGGGPETGQRLQNGMEGGGVGRLSVGFNSRPDGTEELFSEHLTGGMEWNAMGLVIGYIFPSMVEREESK